MAGEDLVGGKVIGCVGGSGDGRRRAELGGMAGLEASKLIELGGRALMLARLLSNLMGCLARAASWQASCSSKCSSVLASTGWVEGLDDCLLACCPSRLALARKRLASGHSGTQRPLSGRNLPMRFHKKQVQ